MSDADHGGRIPLRIVLLVLATTLTLGLLVKAPCLSGNQTGLCYSDIPILYHSRHLDEGRFPYLDARIEYPVVTGLFMGVAAKGSSTDGTFFVLNAAGLALAGLITGWLLYRLAGNRALYFAAAPSVILYAYLNWDLLAIGLATGALWAYFSRRPVLAGVLLGLGISAKLYPGLLLLPLMADAARAGRRRAAVQVAAATAAAWLVVNLPFAIVAFRNWSDFYRFNATRSTVFNTLWSVGCHRLLHELRCTHITLINELSLALFIAGAIVVWRAKVRRAPDFPRWTFAFPLLLLFLLTTKIYSPQYALWVLPLFALALPDLRYFLAFEAVDLAVYLTEFSWLRRFAGYGGLPIWPVEIAVVARAAVLVACVIAYTSRPDPTLEGVESWPTPPPGLRD